MDEQDVLISDYRVMALGNQGQYVFEWVDKEKNTIEFNKNDSNYDKLNNDVKSALAQSGLKLINYTEDEQIESAEETINDVTETNTTEQTEEISLIETNIEEPTEKTDNEEELENEIKDVEETKNTKETVSFIVRMSDSKEREQNIKQFKEINEEIYHKLQLTGPFKVTYQITNNNIELKEVEDLGIGEKTK